MGNSLVPILAAGHREISLSRCCICSEEGLQKLPWMDALSSGGLQQTGKNAAGRLQGHIFTCHDFFEESSLKKLALWR